MGSSAGWESFGGGIFDAWSAPWTLNKKIGGKVSDYFKGPDAPRMPDAPAGPAEDIDVAGQSEYTKARAKQRKGRASTILGSNNKGKKTVLG